MLFVELMMKIAFYLVDILEDNKAKFIDKKFQNFDSENTVYEIDSYFRKYITNPFIIVKNQLTQNEISCDFSFIFY